MTTAHNSDSATPDGMLARFNTEQRRAIKAALAREAYRQNVVRIVQPDVQGFDWLATSNRGVFAISQTQVQTVINGWFFGICRQDDTLYLFENCGLRDRDSDLGRIVRIDLQDGRLANPAVLVTGLHTNCHQIRVIDGLLCLIDTANQAIRRYSLDGKPVDVKRPFPPAPLSDTSGRYLHCNSAAKVDGRIALMLHNSKAIPEKHSEIAWLDADWNLISRSPIDGHWCHDIVQDERGVLWHCDSRAGAVIASDGRRAVIDETLMTRAISISADRMVVGLSLFGARQDRDASNGAIAFLDRELNPIGRIELEGPPADIVAL